MQEFENIRREFNALADANDWHPKHSPKNLSMAVAIEAAELMEIFQWLTDEQVEQLDAVQRQHAAHEIADVFLYLLCLADKLNIDLIAAAKEKMQINRQRFGEPTQT